MKAVDLEGVQITLRHMTHDARKTIKDCGLIGLNAYWQVRLMELTYNYNPTTIIAIIKAKANKMPGHPAYSIIKESIKYLTTRKRHHNAVFSNTAIAHLYRIDNKLLVADYNVRLEDLAIALDRLDERGLNETLSDSCIGIGLILTKIEEYLGRKQREHEFDDFYVYKPIVLETLNEDSKKLIKEAIADIKNIRGQNGQDS